MYRYEMHLHTSACSACAPDSVEQMVYAAKEAGYAGFVITNHFYNGNSAVDRDVSWTEFVEAYARDWRIGKTLGEQLGIEVFFGVEEEFGGGKEILVYGMTPEQLADVPEWKSWGLEEMERYCHSCGAFLTNAHPFRRASYILNPDAEPDITKFDAIEVYNRGNTPEANEKALAFAKRTAMPMASGGDVHRACDFGTSGIAFFDRITTNEELVAALKSGRWTRIVEGVLAE